MQLKRPIAVNRHFIDKLDNNDSEQKRILTHEFENLELTPDELVAFINDGYPFCAQHKGGRKEPNFICSGYLAVDIDDGVTVSEALDNPYVRQYASFLYTTPSHTPEKHRFRLGFQLEHPITDAQKMRAAYIGAIRLFGGDGSCKDACRLFFGSKGSNPIVLGNILPTAELDKLIMLGSEVRVNDSNGDPEGKTTWAPVGNRSKISLDRDQLVRLKNGGMAALQELNARTPIHCPVHLDRNPSAMVTINRDGKRGVFCSRCVNTFWPEDPARARHSHHDFNRIADAVRQLAHEEFPYHHDDLYNVDDADNLIEPTPEDISDWQSLLAGRVHVVHHDKFLPDRSLQPGVAFVRSRKGSGKSEQLKLISRQCKERGQSMVLFGHRQLLLLDLANRLDLTPYIKSEDGKVKNNHPTDRYAICVDSMWKLLKPHIHKYDVVIVDEAEQVFSHIAAADTLGPKRRHCYELLCYYLRYAKSVVLCDADLGTITVEAMKQVIEDETSYRFYLNDYRPTEKQYDLYADENHLVTDMLTAIGNGGRHYVATNSKRKAEKLHAAITSTYPDKKAMLVTAQRDPEASIQYFVDNIKTEILNYDVVIASPTLGTGIDITFDNETQEIDTVFGFFVSRVNTHFDMDQQLARVRHPKAVKVWVTPERFNFETDPSAIEAELILCRNLNDMITGYKRDGTPELDEFFLKVYSHVAATQRASKNALRHHFIQLRKQNGWTTNVIERSIDASKEGATQMKEATALIEGNRIDGICNATPVSAEEYRELANFEKIKSIAPVDAHSMRHYELTSFYCKPVDADLVKLDDHGKFRDRIRLAEVYFSPMWSAVSRSRRFDDESVLAPDAAMLPLKRDLLQRLLTSAGLADKTNAIKCDVSLKQADLKRFAEAYRNNATTMEQMFGLAPRGDLDRNPMQSLTPVLKLIGLSTKKSANYKVEKGRVREYQVDPASVALVKEIIERRASR
ncbi:plasmid replication protein, CyRepA1 family [Ralstonia holmesii]|uniref:plasmid replication protein, CyRepA1 family n=1 Tax=Ralstonia TaxID=48736 RepID=UPI00046839A5|nr:plasmid replication protein, CyRepA1 family [Ralstonia pickettii]